MHQYQIIMTPQSPYLISLNNAGIFRSDRWLVRGVSFNLEPGEILTLIGPNGSGKSTTAKIALGIYSPDEGSSFRRHKLKVRYVPQRFACLVRVVSCWRPWVVQLQARKNRMSWEVLRGSSKPIPKESLENSYILISYFEAAYCAVLVLWGSIRIAWRLWGPISFSMHCSRELLHSFKLASPLLLRSQ